MFSSWWKQNKMLKFRIKELAFLLHSKLNAIESSNVKRDNYSLCANGHQTNERRSRKKTRSCLSNTSSNFPGLSYHLWHLLSNKFPTHWLGASIIHIITYCLKIRTTEIFTYYWITFLCLMWQSQWLYGPVYSKNQKNRHQELTTAFKWYHGISSQRWLRQYLTALIKRFVIMLTYL